MSKPRTFAVGDRVQLTSKFLRCTGQYTGREPQSVWTITGLTNGDRWAITDEPRPDDGMFSAEELAADPTLAFRRIAVGNLQRVKR
jgi:hypothetical protein